MLKKLGFFIFAIIAIPCLSFSQKAKSHVLTADEAKLVKKDANTLFVTGDYRGALTAYLELYKTDKNNVDYNYKIGYCYLQTNVNKAAALPYMKFACESKDMRKDWLYPLGQAYMFNAEWDEAIKAFNDFKNSKAKFPKDGLPVDRMIEMCGNGKALSANPVEVKWNNLGKGINTIYDEYNPYISADGKSLVFASRRKGNVGGFIADLGIYTADLYFTNWKDTAWTKVKSLGGLVNSEWDEEIVGISPGGEMILIYFDNSEAYADIGASSLKGKMWQKPVMLSPNINGKSYEGGAAISNDGTEIYFSSNRKDALGGNDIWLIKKETSGEWGTPVNLGNKINSKYDEESPFISLDGKTLYFASKGHNSMGGFDLFRSVKHANGEWSEPVNLGFPLNDADDNNFISMTADGRFMYIAAVRPEGLGDRDIYKVEISAEPKNNYLIGNVAAETTGKIEITKVSLLNNDGNPVAEFRPESTTNTYILPVTEGTYTLKAEGYNFEAFREEITITSSQKGAIEKNIRVKAGK